MVCPRIPHAPGAVPLLGHAPVLALRPMRFLESLRETGRLVRVELGSRSFILVTDPNLVRELLVKYAGRVERGLIYDRARDAFGNGLATSDGEFHRRQRRLIQPNFSHSRITGYADVMSRRAAALAQSWRPGALIRLDRAMEQLTLNIAADTLFDHDLTPGTAEQIRLLVPVIIRGLLWRMVLPPALDRWFPLAPVRRYDRASAQLRAAIHDGIVAHRHAAHAGADGGNLLAILTAGNSARICDEAADESLCDEVVSLLIAGSETLASTLSWTFHELARHPDAQRHLHQEVDTVIGTRPAEHSDLPRLHYTGRVIDEVLRLHPPLLFSRRIREPIELAGVRLPASTEVAYSPHALHRDPAIYPQPTAFHPDRWLTEAAQPTKSTYAPFGLGPHRCIGEAYARTELTIVTATLAARWRLQPALHHRVPTVPAEIPRPQALPMIALPRR